MKKLLAVLLIMSLFITVVSGTSEDISYGLQAHAAEKYVSACNVGDTVVFGVYEQDNNTKNGPEPIEWIVLENEGENFLLISKYGLESRSYHWEDTKYKYTTWETSTMRAWLNDKFLNGAFTEEERASIVPVTIVNDDNPEYGVEGGNDTTDHVYMLSHDEVLKYFPDSGSRCVKATKYARANRAYHKKDGSCYWWLRTPGKFRCNAEYIFANGVISVYGSDVGHDMVCARPVINLKQTAIEQNNSLELDKHNMVVSASDIAELTAIISPAVPKDRTEWKSSDTLVASVDEKGDITVNGLGAATISVTLGGLTDSCELVVVPGFDIDVEGAAISVTDPLQMRFGMSVNKDNVYEKYRGEIASVGMLIAPRSVSGEEELTRETAGVLDITASVFCEDDSSVTYSVVLSGIPEDAVDTELVCRGYISYSDSNGRVFEQYSGEISRSYHQTACAVKERYSSEEQDDIGRQLFLDKLEKLFDKLNASLDE